MLVFALNGFTNCSCTFIHLTSCIVAIKDHRVFLQVMAAVIMVRMTTEILNHIFMKTPESKTLTSPPPNQQ